MNGLRFSAHSGASKRWLISSTAIATAALAAFFSDHAFADTTINPGDTVVLTSSEQLGAGPLTVDGTLDLGSFTQTVTALSGTNGTISSNYGKLVVDQDGTTTFSGSVTGNGFMQKLGTGTLNMNGSVALREAKVGGGGLTLGAETTATAEYLIIGGTNGAALTIANGASLTTTDSLISDFDNQFKPGDTPEAGTLTVTGTDSKWVSTNAVTLGFYGSGTVNVDDGGSFSTEKSVTVASFDGSNGAIKVSGEGSTWKTGFGMVLGEGGNATYTISDKAKAADGAVTIAQDATSTAFASVSGKDTEWRITNGTLVVGQAGKGAVKVDDSASVSVKGLVHIGNKAGSQGRLTVTGTGSRFVQDESSNPSLLYVSIGNSGADARLDVQDGGYFSGAKIIGGFSANSKGDILVEGDGSVISGTTYIMLGYLGTASATVRNGGTLRVTKPDAGIYLGYASSGAGTLNIGAGQNAPAAAPGFVDAAFVRTADGAGTIVFNHTSDDYEFGTRIVGGGSVYQLAGTTRLTAENSFTGTFFANGGKLVGDSASLTGDMSIGETGTVEFEQVDQGQFGGTVIGSGALVKSGAGTLGLTGDASGFSGSVSINAGTLLLTGALAGNSTIAPAGTLQVGDGVVNGDLTGGTVNNGMLIFDQTGDYDYTGALSGEGSLVKRGNGTLTLSGNYNYTGATVVQAGAISLDATLDEKTDLVLDGGVFDLGGRGQSVASLSGTGGTLLLGTAGRLTVNQSGDSTFSGVISGGPDSQFAKSGTGAINLTGNSTFTGQASVNGGRLAVNGALPGLVVVNQDGTLGGNGIVAGVTARQGGIVAPGNSIGTLQVTSDITFNGGSIYAVEVDSSGANDRIVAGGTAYLQGGTVVVAAAPGVYDWNTDYTILTAATIDGTFANATANLPFLSPSLVYAPDSVMLKLTRNDVRLADVATTPNHVAVANALDSLPLTSPLLAAVAGQSDPQGARTAFDALSGELWATAGTMMIDQSRRTGALVLDRMRQVTATKSPAVAGQGATTAEDANGIAFWGVANGSWTKADGDGNAAGARWNSGDFAVGADTGADDWRLGAAYLHQQSDLSISGGLGSADAESNALSLYGGGTFGGFLVSLGASYQWYNVDGNRAIVFPGFSSTADGSYDGQSVTGFGELSYAASFGKSVIEPFANVNYVHLSTDGFNETGYAGLSVGSAERDVTFTTIGVRAGTDIALPDGTMFSPYVSAGWQHAFGDIAAAGSYQLQAGGAPFSVTGLPVAENAFDLRTGFEAAIGARTTVGLSYVGNFSEDQTDNGVRLSLSTRF